MKVVKGLMIAGLKVVAATTAGAMVFGLVAYLFCDLRIRLYDPASNGFGEGFLVAFAGLSGAVLGASVGLAWAVWPYSSGFIHPEVDHGDSRRVGPRG